MKKLFLSIMMGVFFLSAQSQLSLVSNFGSNPGNLSMYRYTPANMPANAPLVLVLHGCTQSASTYASESDWNSLADTYKFHLIYAEQKSGNNSSKCFNWFETGDINRGSGEAASLKNMTDYMKNNYSIDNSRVFVTGFSAGGAMTTVMLAAYPDVFSAGAVMSGLPYKVATSSNSAFQAMYGNVNQTPTQLGNSVRNASSHTGPWPTVGVFHGTSDYTVYYMNQNEIMEQWTNVHGTDQTADAENGAFQGNSVVSRKEYRDGSGNPVVVTYSLSGMGHAIAIDPGSGATQGGNTGSYASDVNFFSSYWSAEFFGITGAPPVSLSPPTNVSATAVSSSQINLSWTDNESTESAYLVKRSTSSGGTYSTIATLAPNTTSYSNTALAASTTYYYKIVVQDANSNTASSGIVSATTSSGGSSNPPAAPSGLATTGITTSSIGLSWQDNSSDENNFVVERSTNGSSYSVIATLSANSTSYSNTGLTPSSTYYYRVKAQNSYGSSGYTSAVSATTSGTTTVVTIEQLTGTGIFTYGNAHHMGQSFTAIANGQIIEIEANLVYAISGSTLKIFSGNTTTGTPIYQQSGVSKGSGWQTITLSQPVSVSNNSVYTFQLTNASIKYAYSNVYSGGNLWYDDISYSPFDVGFIVSISTGSSSRLAAEGITPESNQVGFRVFPNPASELLHVTSDLDDLPGVIEIYSLSGKVIYQKAMAGKIDEKIRLSGWNPGIYTVVLQTGHQRLTHKLIIH